MSTDRAFVESFASTEHCIDGERVRIAVGENVSISVDFGAHSIRVEAPPGVPISVEPDDKTRNLLNQRRTGRQTA